MKVIPAVSTPFKIIGHKGLSIYKVPENTIPALRRALEAGFLIETDVQKVKDGYVMVHDKYLSGPNDEEYEGRTKIESHYGNGFYLPSGKKLVTECTLDELLKAIFDKAKLEAALSSHAGEEVCLEITEPPKIATLDDLILLLKQFPDSRTFLEIKRPDAYAVYDDGLEEEINGMLSDGGVLHNIIFNSGNESTLRNIRKINDSVPISIDTDYAPVHDLTHNMGELRRLAKEIGLNFWNPPFCDVDKKLLDDVENLKDEGLNVEVATWVQNETKKEELAEIKRLKSIGVRYLFTDQAEEALKIFTETG